MKTIICDIDGTIAKMGSRKKYLEQSPKDYDKFYDEVDQDEPIQPVIELLRKYVTTHAIVMVTGRCSSCYKKTHERLEKHHVPFSWIYTREYEDHRPDTIVKKEIYDTYLSMEDIEFVLEDRKQVKKMRVELGLFVLDVNQHDEVF